MAEPFRPICAPIHYGILPETLPITHPPRGRTPHSLVCGHQRKLTLFTQTLYEPLAPLGALAELDGWSC